MQFTNLQELQHSVGRQLPPSEWITVSQEMVNDFAQATGDHQWIHVDVEKAKKYSPFGTTVAHGFMSLALLSRLVHSLIMVDSARLNLNYGLNKVRFPAPVPVGSRLRLHCTIAAAEPYPENGLKVSWGCTVEIEGQPKPACVGEWITLMFE